ncbi:MAG: hypothetical protein ABJ246_03855 [Paracoccaceae bacterium]
MAIPKSTFWLAASVFDEIIPFTNIASTVAPSLKGRDAIAYVEAA